MKRSHLLILLPTALLACAGAFAQSQESPPTINSITFSYAPAIETATGVVRDTFTPCGQGLPYDPANASDVREELDTIFIDVVFTDPDFEDDDMNPLPPGVPLADSENIFYELFSTPLFAALPPVPGPLAESTNGFVQVSGLRTTGTPNQRRFCLSVVLPQINGRSIARLRGEALADAAYSIRISLANDQDPEENEVVRRNFTVYFNKSRFFLGPNPPPFASAGADAMVEVGRTVRLDGRLSFDGTNIGFGDNGTVFERDELTYTWEWLSGPVRIDPTYPDPVNQPAIAEVTPTQIGEYVYRLTVSDNFNPLPSQDIVTLTVVSGRPPDRRPIARISGPTAPVVVGSVIQLDAGGSLDPDGDALTYRWVQTDELGAVLDPTLLRQVFQPIGGLDSPVSSWQALQPGTYFFRLLVSANGLTDTETFRVEVVNSSPNLFGSVGTAGSPRGSERDGADDAEVAGVSENQTLAPACGPSMLPLAAIAMGLGLMRRRS
jgi:hypothetical protein